MKIKYNAPVTLSFAFLCGGILALDSVFKTNIIPFLFTAYGRGQFNPTDWLGYVRLFTHVAGHANWLHFIGNFTFILLLGPILEEKYGASRLLGMMLITAFVTGIIYAFFFEGLLGASGIAFMMILLISFTNFEKGEIPLTLILIIPLYLMKEIFSINSSSDSNIAHLAHIAGGLCGGLFGFTAPTKLSDEDDEPRNMDY